MRHGSLLVCLLIVLTSTRGLQAQVTTGPACLHWVQQQSLAPRAGTAMAYDSGRGVTVLFGGYDGAYKGDTWEWDGNTWRSRSTLGPSPRTVHAMAYDSARGVTVLFGGQGNSFLGDTWEWDGRAWTIKGSSGPPPRAGHALVYDSGRGVAVLFGGGNGLTTYHDTWEWNGTEWSLRTTTGPAPRGVHAMAYDRNRGVTVLFGGAISTFGASPRETWEWDGTVWTSRGVSGPSSRYGHAMSYDGARNVTVLFGGQTNRLLATDTQTWEWDGTTWTPVITSGPSPRAYHAMAYDSQREMTVLFGGFGVVGTMDDTWELVAFCDEDGDGIEDDQDACAESDLHETVLIADCDSGVANHVLDDGCTMMDRIAECEAAARNHGAFVTCVSDWVKQWSDEGVIDANEKGDIVHCAAQADAPLRRVQKLERSNPGHVDFEEVEDLSQP